MVGIMTETSVPVAPASESGTAPGLDAAAATLADRIRVLLRDGRLNVAKLLVPALLRMAGEAAEARLLAAEVALAADDFVSAAREAAEAVVKAPERTAAKAVLGRALLGLGRREAAASCLLDARQGGDREQATLVALADAAPGAALDALFAALREAPRSAKLYRTTARALLDTGDAAAAASLCRVAASAGVSDPSLQLMAIESAGSVGDWQEALAICEALEATTKAANA